ncbi:hypothetical protein HZH66_012193 [Vespula vulgaris]|uniref:Uncharacterized protein n=1 Tax=Vespula vulgaris TaxID=7454 RepID=A0A834JDE9_VESVU|nr:hypothetical protein HZH66_012193 [Vespula vulgaris]
MGTVPSKRRNVISSAAHAHCPSSHDDDDEDDEDDDDEDDDEDDEDDDEDDDVVVAAAAGPPVQLEPVDLSVKTPVVLQVPRYNPAVIISAAARRVPSPSTTPTPPPASLYVSSTE